MADVTSQIVLETLSAPSNPNRRERILLIGVSGRGRTDLPINVNESNVEEIFGEVPNDSSKERSIVKGFYEVINNSNSGVEVDLMRIGPTTNANLDLYENQNMQTGDQSYGLPAVPCMFLEMLIDGPEGNGVTVKVTDDTLADGRKIPTQLKITLPDSLIERNETGEGESIFSLDPLGLTSYGAKNVVELADAINTNANLSGILRAQPYLLEKETEITITADVDGNIDRVYDIGPSSPDYNESWGDKLYKINSIVEMRAVTLETDAGYSEYDFEVLPNKDTDPLTSTLDKITRVVEKETVVYGKPSEVGKYTAVLSVINYKGGIWSGSELEISKVEKHIGNNEWEELTVTEDYSLSIEDAEITFTSNAFSTGFQLGDVVRVSYKYPANYVESHLRKDLDLGKEHSFFIAGDKIVFGASQSYGLEIKYTAKYAYEPGEVTIGDPSISEPDRSTIGYRDIILYFNGPTLPEEGNTVKISYQYMPELPAATGDILQKNDEGDTFVQKGSLSGGSNGAALSTREYKKYLQSAYKTIANLPYKFIIPQGIYLDDVMEGFGYQTGLPEKQPANIATELISAVHDRSYKVAECQTVIPTKPPQSSVIGPKESKEWINRHSTVSNSDDPDEYIRPANIIQGMYGLSGAFRTSIVMGTPIGTIPQVNTQSYIMNPANVYVAMRYDLEDFNRNGTEPAESMKNKKLPVAVSALAVEIADSDLISTLSSMGYTVMVTDPVSGKPIIADAPTLAVGTQLARQFVVDTTLEAVELVREAVRKFVGKGKTRENIQSMRMMGGNNVKKLVPRRLSNFYLNITEPVGSNITGELDVELSLTTFVEIQKVNMKTKIKLS